MLKIGIVDDEIGDLVDVLRNLLALDSDTYPIDCFPVLLADPLIETPDSVEKIVADNGKRRLEQKRKVANWPRIEVLGKLCPVEEDHRRRILKYFEDREVHVLLCDSWIGRDPETKTQYGNAALELSGVMLLDAAEQMPRFSGNCWMMTKYKPEVSSKLFDAARISDVTGWRPRAFDPLNVRRPRYVDKNHIIECKPGLCDKQLRRLVEESIAVLKLAEAIELPDTVVRDGRFHDLVGRNHRMLQIYAQIQKLSRTKLNVLLTGKTGTGKKLVAQALCGADAPRRGTFIKQNCSGIQDSLFEGIVYGYAPRSGINNADPAGQPGIFERANRGVLFLDEIGDMPEVQQAKLFTILDDEVVTRVMGTTNIPLDVRIVSATNRPLSCLREELLYRLNQYEIEIPTLLERLDDLPLLAQTFADDYGRKVKAHPMQISEATLDLLMRHLWPGNVRELRAVVERAVVDAGTGTVINPDNPAMRKFAAKLDQIGTVRLPDQSHVSWPVEKILEGINAGLCAVQSISAWAREIGEPRALELAELAIKRHGGGRAHLPEDQAKRLFGMQYHTLMSQVSERRKETATG